MPSNYSGDNVYPDAFQLPDDGVDPTASEVNVGLEALADRTTWLRARVVREELAQADTWQRIVLDNQVPDTTLAVIRTAPMAIATSPTGRMFLVATADLDAANVSGNAFEYVQLLESVDGINWRREIAAAVLSPSSFPIGALLATSDSTFVAGAQHLEASGASTSQIYVAASGSWAVVSLAVLTNWSAAEYDGTRIYMFGGKARWDGEDGASDVAAVYISSNAGVSFATATYTGGSLPSARWWRTAQKPGVAIVAVPDSGLSYVRFPNGATQGAILTFPGAGSAVSVCRHVSADGVDEFVAVSGGQVYASPDGASWTARGAFSVAPSRLLSVNGRLFAWGNTITRKGRNWMRLYTSSDDGVTWTQLGFEPLAAVLAPGWNTDQYRAITARADARAAGNRIVQIATVGLPSVAGDHLHATYVSGGIQ